MGVGGSFTRKVLAASTTIHCWLSNILLKSAIYRRLSFLGGRAYRCNNFYQTIRLEWLLGSYFLRLAIIPLSHDLSHLNPASFLLVLWKKHPGRRELLGKTAAHRVQKRNLLHHKQRRWANESCYPRPGQEKVLTIK